MNIQNYVLGQWVNGGASEYEARNAITGASLGHVSSDGLHYADILSYGREKGGEIGRASCRERV